MLTLASTLMLLRHFLSVTTVALAAIERGGAICAFDFQQNPLDGGTSAHCASSHVAVMNILVSFFHEEICFLSADVGDVFCPAKVIVNKPHVSEPRPQVNLSINCCLWLCSDLKLLCLCVCVCGDCR